MPPLGHILVRDTRPQVPYKIPAIFRKKLPRDGADKGQQTLEGRPAIADDRRQNRNKYEYRNTKQIRNLKFSCSGPPAFLPLEGRPAAGVFIIQ